MKESFFKRLTKFIIPLISKRNFLFFIFVFQSFLIFSQPKWTLQITATVFDGKKKLEGAVITIYKNGTESSKVTTDKTARHIFTLEPGFDYLIKFSKKGYVAKSLSMNTRNVPEGEVDGTTFRVQPDIELFEEMEGLDVSILNKPIGKLAFNSDLGDFTFDSEYTSSIQAQLAALQRELEQKLKEEAEKLARYNSAIAKADKAFSIKKYDEAKASYNEALTIKPKEEIPKDKIAQIDSLLAEEAKAKALAEAEAKAKAESAAKAAAEAEAKKKAEEEAKAKALAEADAKAKAESAAKAAAEAAAKKKAEAEANTAANEAARRKAEADAKAKAAMEAAIKAKAEEDARLKLLADAQAKAKTAEEENKKYNQSILKADQLFKAKEYQASKAFYNEALNIKPIEKYPKERIAEIEKLLSLTKQNNEQKQTEKELLAELPSKYPEGVTEESYIEPGRKIIKRIVVKGNDTNEYTKVIYSWAVYYFKNGDQPITEQTWNIETK